MNLDEDRDSILPELTCLRGLSRNSEAYWAAVKNLFPLKPGLIALNAANLCPSSRPVTKTLIDYTTAIDDDPSFENRVRYESSLESTRRLLAGMLGAAPEELAINRNTSEGNRTIIDGLDLGPGDEIVVWDQNHESNGLAWEMSGRRRGFTVKHVSLPLPLSGSDQIVRIFTDSMGPRTRVVAFSHASNLSGIALPAESLCKAIKAHGALSLVDGAQTFGMSVLDLHRMECDFFTCSSHKWFCGPRETGVLYVRRNVQDRIWPATVSYGWQKIGHKGARKFENLGQRDDARLEALCTAVRFYNGLGGEYIEARVRAHVDRLMRGLKALSSEIEFLTPVQPELQAANVIFRFPSTGLPVMEILYRDYGISALAFDLDEKTLVRFAPNIYNTPEEIDTAIMAIKRVISV